MSDTPSTPLGYALIGLVHEEPRSGYDLCQLFETTPIAHYSSSPGAIYPALKRLEKKGLVAGETEEADSLRPRRVYRPTQAGLEALRAWASQEISVDDMVKRSDEMMLRFAFLGLVAERAASRRFLEQLAAASDAYADELETYRRGMLGLDPPNGRLALECGLDYHRNLARWARHALGELRRDT